MSFNDKLAMKQPDTEALLLRGLEWPEQQRFDKFFRHSTSVVAHGKTQRIALVERGDLNQAVPIDSFVRVDDEIGQNLVNLLGVQKRFGNRPQVRFEFCL